MVSIILNLFSVQKFRGEGVGRHLKSTATGLFVENEVGNIANCF